MTNNQLTDFVCEMYGQRVVPNEKLESNCFLVLVKITSEGFGRIMSSKRLIDNQFTHNTFCR